jgi:hypothetical protein
MGIDTDVLERPDDVSADFICPVCQGVCDPPVSTPCEHLFCEGCLLSWLQRRDTGSETCPMCNAVIDPQRVAKPSRIILNIIGELKRRCDHSSEGCPWVGPMNEYAAHARSCEFVPRALLRARIVEQENRITDLSSELKVSTEQVELMELENRALREQLQVFEDLHGNYQRTGARSDSIGSHGVLHSYAAYKQKFGTHRWDADDQAQAKLSWHEDESERGGRGGGLSRLQEFAQAANHAYSSDSFESDDRDHHLRERRTGDGEGRGEHSGRGGRGEGSAHRMASAPIADLNDVQRIHILRNAQARLEQAQAEGRIRDSSGSEDEVEGGAKQAGRGRHQTLSL